MANSTTSKLRVAIIGAGPAGLGAAIEFAKLPFVDLRIYEQARELREVGTGISLQRNTWRLLDVFGVLENINPSDFFRSADGHSVQHRNGRTGDLLLSNGQKDTPPRHKHARALRTVLQRGLLDGVDASLLRLSSRLIEIIELPNGALSLRFEDGRTDEVDLLVGADGVRSVVRSFAFPDHHIGYTGRAAYRALVDADKILRIPNFPDAVTFWHGPKDWVYTCNLNNNIYEVTTMAEVSGEIAKVSWGEDATLEEFRKPYREFAPIVQAVLDEVKEVKRFALFAGPRLSTVISRGSIALIGDASHPLSGAFGAGAGFALEDVFVLTQSVKWAYERDLPVGQGLQLFDNVRSPHYEQLYGILDEFAKSDATIGVPITFDDAVARTVSDKWSEDHHWLYHYDEVWKEAYKAEDARIQQEDSKKSESLVYQAQNMSSHLQRIRLHPWYSVAIVAWTAFCHPGMFGALNGLGAAGEETASLSNVVNAVTFGALTVGGFFTGIICNKIGTRWTLALGTLGYAPYADPSVQERGRAVATKFTLQNFASSLGGMISLGLNIRQSQAGRVSDSTFFVFISIMALGLPAAVTIPRPNQVIRGDGSRVSAHRFQSWKEELAGLRRTLGLKSFHILFPFLIYWQWDLSYMWSWNAQYHSVRARALLSTLFYLVGPTFIGPIQGYLLDNAKWSRKTRARVAVVSFTILTLLTWIYGLVVQYQYDKQTTIIDIKDPVFIKSCLLFILYGLIENSAMVTGYWIIGSLGLDPGSVATFVGLAVPGLLYTGFKLVTEDAVIDAATTQVDWIDTAETNEAISSREKGNVHSVTEASLSTE
ncbi:Major facilitator superfamily domain, general substrate transporter [Penicillium expansum]|nr:Major facilitator superfamily domain, general substrate transporter [Penicillium expansum]